MRRIEKIEEKNEIKNKINKISNAEAKSLACFLYLFGCRIGEIVGKLRKEQIEYVEENTQKWLIVKEILTEKKKKKWTRTLPLLVLDDEKEMVDEVINWANLCKEDILWNKSIRYYQIIFKNAGFFAHHLRACRATYLAQFMTPHELCAWFGWSKVVTSDVYVRLSGMNLKVVWDKLKGEKG